MKMLKLKVTTFLSVISTIYSSDIDTFYTNCQNSAQYGCFTAPDNCVQNKTCDYGATWMGTSETIYQFQLISNSSDYVAIGFPNVSSMGPAPVIGCSPKFESPAIYYNTASYASAAAFNHSDFVSLYHVSAVDNIVSCVFNMNSSFIIAATNTSGESKYDLNKNSSFIMRRSKHTANPLLLGQA